MSDRLAAFCLFTVLGLAGATLNGQENKQAPPPAASEFKVPPDEAKRENPVKPTPASIADGKHIFSTQCIMCHGKDADGQGELAVEMKLKLKDYRDPAALKDMTDGELLYFIKKGKGDMPGQEDRMKPEQCWNLVNYIRSIPRKDASKGKEEKPK